MEIHHVKPVVSCHHTRIIIGPQDIVAKHIRQEPDLLQNDSSTHGLGHWQCRGPHDQGVRTEDPAECMEQPLDVPFVVAPAVHAVSVQTQASKAGVQLHKKRRKCTELL